MTLELRIIAALVSFIVLAGAMLGYGHWQYSRGVKATTDVYEAALSKQKAAAAITLSGETMKVLESERKYNNLKSLQESKDVDHQTIVSDLGNKLRIANGAAVRLRDPNAAPGCRLGSSSPQSPATPAPSISAENSTETGGLLSVQLSDLLVRLLREADEGNNAYISCRSDAYTVRDQTVPQGE